ncbi:complex I NDUFA9 subunit family protein [Denitrobaculum tricleocarpae]|uniref:Complex I NDUFA9 subunit family protein n=1 Tax=Denitrobaculum tricleocarpae TaxID=2591009 RepID=A0A545U154_9PROT|nr:complex I NDUFA9 subunit family protein [Denitrobaculum tricleocarpae]TQV83217.1 complex I NDUFA9 subunit family protein [Denitrobaculum tricleocarpae]
MPRQKVTIFGGSGFLGRHLVTRLARTGWSILLAERHPSRAHFLQPLGDVGQIAAVAARVQDEARVAEVVAGADAVVNLTGILYESGNQRFDGVHTTGAANIARAAAGAQVKRLVQVSAIGADPDSEADYARSKGKGEEAVRQAFPDATILRPSIVIGPEDGFFNRFADMTRISPFLPLVGGGKTRFQPVYVGDVAQAIQMGLEQNGLVGQTYELGGPGVYSFKALLQMLLKEIGRRRLLLPLPFAIASLQATFLELLPVPPLTRDQVRMLRSDNIVSEGAKGFAELGITPKSVETIIPTYLERHRAGGRFSAKTSR